MSPIKNTVHHLVAWGVVAIQLGCLSTLAQEALPSGVDVPCPHTELVSPGLDMSTVVRIATEDSYTPGVPVTG